MSRAASIALGLLLLAPLSAAARQGVESPHGPLAPDLDCSACHTAQGWSPLRVPLLFDHDERTGFRLTDAHARASCAACHLELRFDGPDIAMEDCAGCHADVHEGRMVRDCADCHDARSFHAVDGEAAHARTSFPLTGAHRQVSCESCHVSDVGGAYTPLETECTSCHAEEYRSTTTVDHVANGYPTDCTECHSTLGWGDTPAFDHAAVSGGFVLLGAHDGLRCARCHVIPGFELLFAPAGQDDCVACHADDYDREHGGSTFPTTCLTCHGVDNWDVQDFDHTFTGFTLVEVHADLSCGACHTGDGGALRFPVPAGQEDCVACHQADYDDKHAGSGFPTTCLDCHTQRNWDAASFNHDLTAFPLVGAHTTAACTTCHGGTVPIASLVSAPTDCVVCHTVAFDAAHGATGYPTECAACHTTTAWQPSTFDHEVYFLLASGPHAEKWSACSDCHPSPADISAYTCFNCHVHEQATMDEKHSAVTGYVWESTACMTCHPRGVR